MENRFFFSISVGVKYDIVKGFQMGISKIKDNIYRTYYENCYI